MIKRQNSEKIFLQPIDQHYHDESFEESLKFCDDYDKMLDCLNMSTDSETMSRKNSTDDESSFRIENALKESWKDNIECLKVTHIHFFKNVLFQKIAMFRSSLETGLKGRTYSCPNKNVRQDINYINPFMRKASDVFSNECVDRLKILEEDKE
jgi:hypothetical protein